MTQEEKVRYWLDIADYDIDTAEAMYKTKRWLYVAFMCHQVIEKTLKAYWSAKRDDIPPIYTTTNGLQKDADYMNSCQKIRKILLTLYRHLTFRHVIRNTKTNWHKY